MPRIGSFVFCLNIDTNMQKIIRDRHHTPCLTISPPKWAVFLCVLFTMQAVIATAAMGSEGSDRLTSTLGRLSRAGGRAMYVTVAPRMLPSVRVADPHSELKPGDIVSKDTYGTRSVFKQIGRGKWGRVPYGFLGTLGFQHEGVVRYNDEENGLQIFHYNSANAPMLIRQLNRILGMPSSSSYLDNSNNSCGLATLEQFSENSGPIRVLRNPNPSRTVDDILEAIDQELELQRPYHLFTNNCQSGAMRAATGEFSISPALYGWPTLFSAGLEVVDLVGAILNYVF